MNVIDEACLQGRADSMYGEKTGSHSNTVQGTTLPKGVARANQALVEGLNNEDQPFAISEKSRMLKGDVESIDSYRGAPPGRQEVLPQGGFQQHRGSEGLNDGSCAAVEDSFDARG
ncbi:hypothetical protein MRB53_035496 [Persea americana]|uniref:Uncharacterized protein n=1 Tax=Persea americana TaxID=3435 RepID=A0ACC2K563_PERAE|nr:hypothetical protein MRB53_035496 [Persea americana]